MAERKADMTFKKFEELFKSKYPQGEVTQHGKFGGTEKTKKTAVTFDQNSKVYWYDGSYQEVLEKLGIKVLYQWEIDNMKKQVERYKAENGKPSLFGGIVDHTADIKRVEAFLQSTNEYIII